MMVIYHPDFAKDLRQFETEYREVSAGLAVQFREEVDSALTAIRAAPQAAGHFLQAGSRAVQEFRRRNLHAFPFFILYGFTGDQLLVGSLIPSRSDPLTWLIRFRGSRPGR